MARRKRIVEEPEDDPPDDEQQTIANTDNTPANNPISPMRSTPLY